MMLLCLVGASFPPLHMRYQVFISCLTHLSERRILSIISLFLCNLNIEGQVKENDSKRRYVRKKKNEEKEKKENGIYRFGGKLED